MCGCNIYTVARQTSLVTSTGASVDEEMAFCKLRTESECVHSGKRLRRTYTYKPTHSKCTRKHVHHCCQVCRRKYLKYFYIVLLVTQTSCSCHLDFCNYLMPTSGKNSFCSVHKCLLTSSALISISFGPGPLFLW